MPHSSRSGVAPSAARQRLDSVEQTTEPATSGGVHRQPNPIRVLVVSEFLLFRAGVTRVLETAGILVVGEATTCADARGAARDEHPDVILLDLDCRGDLYDCVAELLAAAESSRVIGLSDPGCADWTRLVEVGGMGLVLKTQPPDVLIKAIQKVHAGELWLERAHTAKVFSEIVARRRRADIHGEKIASLTRREREIVELVGEGLRNAAIGERLFISESTVRNHLTSIFGKLGVGDRFELVVYAFKHGLVRYAAGGTKPAGREPA